MDVKFVLWSLIVASIFFLISMAVFYDVVANYNEV